MRNRARLVLVASLLLAAPGLRAEEGVSDAEIVIGQCAALAGPAAGLGTGMNSGLKAALDEANAAGGVFGRRLRLVSTDDGYEPDRTVDRTVALIEQDKVFALAGYVGTPTAKVALPIVQEAKVPLVGIFSGAMLLREPVQRYVINIRASYDDETEALIAHLAGVRKLSRIGILYQNDSFGLAGLSGTEKALKKRGLTLAGKGTFERNTLAVKSGLAQIAEARPEAVVVIGPYKPTAAFVKEARAAGLQAVFATISFVGTENLIAELGGEASGLLISQVVPSPGEDSLPLVKAYQAALGKSAAGEKPSYVSLEGYLTGRVLLAGLQAVGRELTREKLLDALEGSATLDPGGVQVGFAKDNHQGSKRVFLTQVAEGKALPVQR